MGAFGAWGRPGFCLNVGCRRLHHSSNGAIITTTTPVTTTTTIATTTSDKQMRPINHSAAYARVLLIPRWDALPDTALMQIIEHLPCRQRYGPSCVGRVSKQWRAAAATVASAITLQKKTHATTLGPFLRSHRRQVNQLHVHAYTGLLEDLPYPHLQSLLLCGGSLDVSSRQGCILEQLHASSAGLTSLKLENVTAVGHCSTTTPRAFLATILPGLKQLSLQHISVKQHYQAANDRRVPLSIPGHFLQQLPSGLTYLELAGGLSDGPLQHQLSCLTNLQHLLLHVTKKTVTGAGLVGLPKLSSLTFLHLSGERQYPLKVPCCALQIAGLEVLCLRDVHMLGVAGVIAGVLRQLQALKDLTLHHVINVYDSSSRAPVYAAISEAPSLQRLMLEDTLVAPTAWQHLFPRDRQLAQLTSLNLPMAFMRSANYTLGSIVQCCPNLKHLSVQRSCNMQAQFPALRQLSALTSLAVCEVGDAECEVLRHLTTLHELRAALVLEVTCKGLELLGELRRLTSLELLNCSPQMTARLARINQRMAGQRLSHVTVLSKVRETRRRRRSVRWELPASCSSSLQHC